MAKSVAPDAADFFSSTPLRNLGLSGLAEEALVRATLLRAIPAFGLAFHKPILAFMSTQEAIGVSRPSHVQAATWRAVGAGAGHVLVADHAGSGKTLAYLVPIIDTLKRDEEREASAALGDKKGGRVCRERMGVGGCWSTVLHSPTSHPLPLLAPLPHLSSTPTPFSTLSLIINLFTAHPLSRCPSTLPPPIYLA